MWLPAWLRDRVTGPARSEVSQMDRRAFLRLAGQGALGLAVVPGVDLERLLWVPSERTIFIPTALDHEQLLPADEMVAEMMKIIKEQILFVGRVHGRRYALHVAEGR